MEGDCLSTARIEDGQSGKKREMPTEVGVIHANILSKKAKCRLAEMKEGQQWMES